MVNARGDCSTRQRGDEGYYKDPDATKAALHDGWFFSGDAAVWHDNGYIQIKDRLKDVIISGGENISSVEVEDISIGTRPLQRRLLSPNLMRNGARFPAPL